MATATISRRPALSRALSSRPAPSSWLMMATPATEKPAWRERRMFSGGGLIFMAKDRTQLLLREPNLYKAFLILALPIFGANFLRAFNDLVDTFFIGQIADSVAAQAGIDEDLLEYYGRYKAKIDITLAFLLPAPQRKKGAPSIVRPDGRQNGVRGRRLYSMWFTTSVSHTAVKIYYDRKT